MSKPKISIITPSFNQGHFIEQTIVSVLEQGYSNLEYIVIDGGSTDNTKEILKKYEKFITFCVSEKDGGQSEAINKGIKRATGDIVNWLNSDDYYMPGALQHVSTQFSDPRVTAYCGRSRIFSKDLEYTSQGTDVYGNNLAKTIGFARIDQPETFFRRSVWDEIGLINEHFHYTMDREWWVRYLFRFGMNGIIRDNKVLVNFRIHGDSKTGSQQARFRQESYDLFYSLAQLVDSAYAQKISMKMHVQVKQLFGYDDIDKELLERAIHYFMLYTAINGYAQNDYNLAKEAAALVRHDLLEPNDLKELESVLFRMKVLPVSAKRILNKIKSKLS